MRSYLESKTRLIKKPNKSSIDFSLSQKASKDNLNYTTTLDQSSKSYL